MLSWAKNLQTQGLFKPAGIGGQAKRLEKVRGDEILWMHEALIQSLPFDLIERLETLKLELNRELFLGLDRFEFHLACYPKGQHYEAHFDQSRQSPNLTSPRVLSFVLYLNESWLPADEGELVILDPEKPQVEIAQIFPDGGRLVLFRSDVILHEVRAPNRERWSLTGWFHRR